MKKNLSLLFMLTLCFTCKKNEIPISDVITNLSVTKQTLLADGSSLDTITVNINNDASLNKRYVTFKITGANITGGSNGLFTAPASYENGVLTAHAVIVAPFKAGTIYISATPKLDSLDNRNFTLFDTIHVTPSLPDFIRIEPSGLGLKTKYENEITITGTVKNIYNNPVSIGTRVEFENHFENGNSSDGSFRQQMNKTDSLSKVSAVYSIYSAPVGSRIIITATVYDTDGNKTNIKDSTILTVVE
jgi:hypothetical protein